jgi:hypothetical protein
MNVAQLPSASSLYELPTGRALFSDTEGRVLRATWHLDRGLVNLSVWHDDRCTETFRLSLGDAAQFVAFLVGGLSDATTRLLHAVATPTPTPTVSVERRLAWTRRFTTRHITTGRARLAAWIDPGDADR